jgi:hypothetical protein
MAWSVFTVLMIFYLLAVFTFHATGSVHILPFVAVAVLVIDYLLARRFKRN